MESIRLQHWKTLIAALLVAGGSLAMAATTIPAKIEAESYANMAGVQLEACSEGTQNVGWIDTGDWMVYPITVPSAGSYTIQYRVASPNSNAVLSSDLNAGAIQLGTVNVPNTGGWQNWTTISQTVALPAGTINLGIFAKAGGFNLNWINVVSNGSTTEKATHLRVLTLGDSITAGYLSTNGSGFRGRLRDLLIGQGYSVDMAGTQRGGNVPDPDHEGHYGWRIDEIATLATGVVKSYQPNIVTLHIGTNDISRFYQLSTVADRLAALIDQIFEAAPDTTLLVGTLVPTTDPTTQANFESYNAKIPGIIAARAKAGKRIYLASMSAVTRADMGDGLHPNDNGYWKMADAFAQAVHTGSGSIVEAHDLPSPFIGTYEIQSAASNLAMSASGASTANGAAVVQEPFNGGSESLWNLIPTEEGYFHIQNAHSALMVNVSGASVNSGAQLLQWPAQGMMPGNDQWQPVQKNDGTYTFVNLNSGMLIDDPAASTSAGTQFVQWPGNNTYGQRFNLIPKAATAATSNVLSINAGGGGTGYFAGDGHYVQTSGGTNSTTSAINTAGVANAAPQDVYKSERWGAFEYTLPGLSPGATYLVRLHFAEFMWNQQGKRVFHVAINGALVLKDFDIFAAAGAINKAVVKPFAATANSRGEIVVTFMAGNADTPKVSGIEIARP